MKTFICNIIAVSTLFFSSVGHSQSSVQPTPQSENPEARTSSGDRTNTPVPRIEIPNGQQPAQEEENPRPAITLMAEAPTPTPAPSPTPAVAPTATTTDVPPTAAPSESKPETQLQTGDTAQKTEEIKPGDAADRQKVTVTESRQTLQEGKYGTGLDLYLGIDLGGVSVNPGNKDKESTKFGYNLGVKAILSLYLEKTVLDIGGGWDRSRVWGDAVTTPEGETPIDYSVITTQTAMAEMSARYRFHPTWEVGPMATLFFGDDSKFSPIATSPEANMFLGVSLMTADRGPSGAARLGVNFITDVTIENRQVYILNLTAQLGVTLINPEPKIVEVRKEVRVESESLKDDAPLKPLRIPEKDIQVCEPLPAQKELIPALLLGPIINFRTADSKMTKRDEAYIAAVADILKANPEAWTSIEIAGHADVRGPRNKNIKYAQDRATIVRKILLKNGLPADKLIAKGYASDKPLDKGNEKMGLARNRRAEVIISGANNPEMFNKKFEDLYRQFHTPSTCTERGCP